MNKKIKILCINANGLFNDGITNSILSYYSHFNMSEFEIHMQLVMDTNKNLVKYIESLGISPMFSAYRRDFLKYIFFTSRQIRLEHYDIVHVHGSSTLLFIDLLTAVLGGCKVRIAHSRNTTCNHKMWNKILRPLFNAVCNERFACGIDAGRWLFHNKSFDVMNNGKNLLKYRFDKETRDKVRKELNIGDYIALGHVGNFNNQKNHEYLVEIFSNLLKQDDCYILVLIGIGYNLDRIKRMLFDLQIEEKVLFLGSIENVSEVLNALDLMLLPSRFEGLPNVVLEWQISGLYSCISDKITDECIVTPYVHQASIDKDTNEWINWIIEYTTKLDGREKRSENSILMMKDHGFDILDNVRFLEDTYKGLVVKYYDK